MDTIFWWTGAFFFTWYMTGIVLAGCIVLYSFVASVCASITAPSSSFGDRYSHSGLVNMDEQSAMYEARSILASYGSC